MNPISPNALCPCNSQLSYADCCQTLHSSSNMATTAEQLMRSRYCAFVVEDYRYLIDTHYKDFLHGLTQAQLAQNNPQWLSLEVIEHQLLSANPTVKNRIAFNHNYPNLPQAMVIFKAWYKTDKSVDVIYEASHFVFESNRWFYTYGEQMDCPLPTRNEACICLSGKKFKQCCGR
ncbi:YchJ family protein [Shewanella gaetbuli]